MLLCPYDGCDASRRHPSELQDHVDFVHEEIFHNVCNHIHEKTGAKCEHKYERRSELTRHKRTHSDARPHQCTVCPKAFKSPGDLTRHERTHSDARPHKCTGCLKAFKFKNVLDRHWVRKHSPPDDPRRTKHKCEECPEGFVTSGDLKQHCLRKH
ncbi:hypothetical protein T484DRAFT_1649762, partial [Baffinella frigidus]